MLSLFSYSRNTDKLMFTQDECVLDLVFSALLPLAWGQSVSMMPAWVPSLILSDLMEMPFWVLSSSVSNLNFWSGLAVSGTGVQGSWHHGNSRHEQDAAGGFTFSLFFQCFYSFSPILLLPMAVRGLSPFSMFSTKCPQVTVLLNLCENLKFRH